MEINTLLNRVQGDIFNLYNKYVHYKAEANIPTSLNYLTVKRGNNKVFILNVKS